MIVGKLDHCDYPTIQEAVDALEKQDPQRPETLYILSGVYEEAVRIYRSDLAVIGIGYVEITKGRYAKELDEKGNEIGTFATPTLFLGGRRLLIENLVVTNSAGQGEDIGQAVAVYAHCDETLFRYCTFKGHQDTLFTGPLPPAPKHGGVFGGIPLREHHREYRQVYEYCRIEGTVDFIFGGAAAFFDRCEIRSLRHSSGHAGYIAAASTPAGQEYGYVFNLCYLTAEPGVSGVYLGRPWREYARTDYVDCRMGGHIEPLGWDDWNDPGRRLTARYREFGTRFDPAAPAPGGQRAGWAVYQETLEGAPQKEQVFTGTDFWKRKGEGRA
ncbi:MULTISPECIES: pectinesterase family protein [Paenibacillus]|uniref:Pectinesterase n=1 Tax=Paenibacillus cineris TaxID=237530 RepID=A0ABQ4L7P2_9BACL|nr:pectinesterase family protein [Paenibacillus cineris]GIO52495.1 pectinesterase [Paenibacillus cineris]